MRRQVPLAITFFVGVVMILASFIPHWPFNRLDRDLSIFFDILAAFAFILGGGNLLKIHLNNISRQAKGWGFSAVTIIGFFGMLIVGVFKIGNPVGIKGGLDLEGSYFHLLYEYVFKPLQATMFALLAFYVASASYRAFRAKNREATMLLIAAFIILFGRTLFGTALTAYLPGSVEIVFGAIFGYLALQAFQSKRMPVAATMGLVTAVLLIRTAYGYITVAGGESFSFITIPALVNWIMIVPQLAGQRAIMIGICLGVVSMSLRIILGVERSHLGSDT